MTKRIAALFGLFAFAVAWLVGVWCGHSPSTRLMNAALALGSGFLGGLGVGVALERIVLARLSQQWKDPSAASPAPAPAPAATAPASAPAEAPAMRNELESVAAVAAGGEAQR
jgi:hypothetical protein